MKQSWSVFGRAARITLLLSLVVLAFGFLPGTVLAQSYCVAGDWQSEAGGVSDWVPNANPMTADGDGTYSLNATISTTGDYEFKVTVCSWDTTFPPGGNNSWFTTTTPNQQITFHFDPTTVAGTYPESNAVAVTGDTHPEAWTAVGNWQGWNNANPATAMTDKGGGIYELVYYVPTASTYDWKITRTGAWDRQYTAIGRVENDGGNGQFTTVSAGQKVIFTLNANTGRISAVPVQPAGQDGTVFWAELGHNSRDTSYRNPGGPVPFGTQVTLRFRTARNDLTNAQVRIWNDRLVVSQTKLDE